MSDIRATRHKRFSFVYIPCDINDEIETRYFEGIEEDFQNLMKRAFLKDRLSDEATSDFKEELKQKSNGLVEVDDFDPNSEMNPNYQILPLILPSKRNNFEALNCYLDEYGKLKGLNHNARASRICSNDIRGPCFLSKSFDDEDTFKRLDFNADAALDVMKSPPTPTGYSASVMSSLQSIMKGDGKALSSNLSLPAPKEKVCASCGLTEIPAEKDTQGVASTSRVSAPSATLLMCSRCGISWYCSRKCQKEDWKYHKRICKPRANR